MSFGFTVDSSNIFGGGNFLNEAGTYNVKVLSTSTSGLTKSSGDPMVTLNYEVVDGVHKGKQVLYDNLVWKEDSQEAMEKSIRRFNTVAVAAGATDGASISSIEIFLRALIDKTLNIEVEWEKNDYNGKWNASVRSHNSFDQEGSKPNGQMRPQADNTQQQSAFGQANSSQPTNQPEPSNPFGGQGGLEIDDSQLPF